MFGFLILREEKMTEVAVKGKTLTNDAPLLKLAERVTRQNLKTRKFVKRHTRQIKKAEVKI